MQSMARADFVRGGAGGGIVGISHGVVAVGIPSSGREATGGPDIPESISTSKIPLRPSSLDGSTVLQEVFCGLICT